MRFAEEMARVATWNQVVQRFHMQHLRLTDQGALSYRRKSGRFSVPASSASCELLASFVMTFSTSPGDGVGFSIFAAVPESAITILVRTGGCSTNQGVSITCARFLSKTSQIVICSGAGCRSFRHRASAQRGHDQAFTVRVLRGRDKIESSLLDGRF
jgi:hypothetical protein